MTIPAGYPATPTIFIHGGNVDGFNNDIIQHGEDVPDWANEGSVTTGFTVASAATNPLTRVPLMKKSDSEACVAFDGVSDVLTCSGSASSVGFIHTTGIFDLLLVLRRKGGAKDGLKQIWGNEGKGMLVALSEYDSQNSTIDSGIHVYINNGSALISNLPTVIPTPVGEKMFVFIRGTGTKLRVTKDFYHWTEQTFLLPLTTGDAAADTSIGAGGVVSGTTRCFDGDVFVAGLWARNITAAEIVTLRGVLETLLEED